MDTKDIKQLDNIIKELGRKKTGLLHSFHTVVCKRTSIHDV